MSWRPSEEPMRIRKIATSGGLRQRGQSTVEFMLMVPVLFAILFFVVEMGLYFTTIHYGTYAAFATARSQQVGFSPMHGDVSAVSDLILTGAVWESGAAQSVMVGGEAAGVRIKLKDFEKKIPFPFIRNLLPSMTFATQVNLGPDERDYEGVEARPPDQYDNNI